MQTVVQLDQVRRGAAAQPAMTITKLSEHIGAEITSLDLTKPVDPATQARLLEALHEHIALVIRDQHLNPAQLVTAGRVFGELMEQDQPEIYSLPEQPLIRRVSNRYTDASGQVIKTTPSWHTDHTNHECPPKYTMLYPVHLPTDTLGGGTSLCNMRAGYESLPEETKRRIDGMQTVNVLASSAGRGKNPLSVAGMAALKPKEVLHPLVRSNPDHGESKSLYFHPKRTERIEGLDPDASQDLLEELVTHAVKPEFVYVHQWKMGDLLIWDNRSSLHRAGRNFDYSQHRLLYRLIVRGERPH